MKSDQGGTALSRDRRPIGLSNRGRLSAATLLLGVAAMLLAIVPVIVFDEPMRWPWDEDDNRADAKPIVIPEKIDADVTVNGRKFTFTIGKKDSATSKPVAAPPSPPQIAEKPPVQSKPFKIASVVASLLGLAVAPFAWKRERFRPVVTAGAVMCGAALVWQYVVVGILIGVGIAVLILILSAAA